MRYLSVCSGIEAATSAWHPLGWQPVGFAEIEPFPSKVLAHHYGSNLPGEAPSRNGVPNFGDFTAIDTAALGSVDLLVGGTPCQAFSVAGKRLSLADARGNLSSHTRCSLMNLLDLMACDGPSGRTSPASSAPMTMPSAVSWQRLSAETMPCVSRAESSGGRTKVWLKGHGHGRHGGFSMLNTSDWPNDAAVCSLSSVLEKGPIPQRYYLSARACAGILRRAEKRGRELPPALQEALAAVAASLTEETPRDS